MLQSNTYARVVAKRVDFLVGQRSRKTTEVVKDILRFTGNVANGIADVGDLGALLHNNNVLALNDVCVIPGHERSPVEGRSRSQRQGSKKKRGTHVDRMKG